MLTTETAEVWSVDPRTGTGIEPVARQASPLDAASAALRARELQPVVDARGRVARAAVLRSAADELEADAEGLLGFAERETALTSQRLRGEIARTSAQLRMFAEVVEEGAYLEATIDHESTAGLGRPDLRRILVPVGPVAVFAAGNFPFAFSVLGGDTAAALAAGCPVIVKVHPGHPKTSLRTFDAWRRGAAGTGTPVDAVQLIFGDEAGRALVSDARVKAVSFTGSATVGRLLYDLVGTRPEPVPFYGELSSVNALVVTAGAAAERADAIAAGLVSSVTGSGGQLCTKPGLIFVPKTDDGDRLVRTMSAAISEVEPNVMLSARNQASYESGTAQLGSDPLITVLAHSRSNGEGLGEPVLFSTDIDDLGSPMLIECFGPSAIVVRYDAVESVLAALGDLPGALAGAIHATAKEDQLVRRLTAALAPKVGRIVYNGYPTGVAVSDAMTHGGPAPATTSSLHSAIGATAIRRFLRPITFQNAPTAILPEELLDESASVPKRVDGTSVLHLGRRGAKADDRDRT